MITLCTWSGTVPDQTPVHQYLTSSIFQTLEHIGCVHDDMCSIGSSLAQIAFLPYSVLFLAHLFRCSPLMVRMLCMPKSIEKQFVKKVSQLTSAQQLVIYDILSLPNYDSVQVALCNDGGAAVTAIVVPKVPRFELEPRTCSSDSNLLGNSQDVQNNKVIRVQNHQKSEMRSH